MKYQVYNLDGEIISDVISDNPEYGYFGIRTQEVPFKLGGIDHCSHVWDDGDMTDVQLSGICATDVRSGAVRLHADGYYYGAHQAILASNLIEYGEDDGELIMRDAVVVHIIR